MDLSPSHKESVQKWASEGASIAQIQNLLKEEFSIGMTYMDVRFLVDDLGVVYSDKEEGKENEGGEPTQEAIEEDTFNQENFEANSGSNVEEADLGGTETAGGGSVLVDVDSVIRPGSLVSGTVRFSDGVSLGWQLTSTGQLGLIPGDDPEYRPSNIDIQAFQSQLQAVLKEKGFWLIVWSQKGRLIDSATL